MLVTILRFLGLCICLNIILVILSYLDYIFYLRKMSKKNTIDTINNIIQSDEKLLEENKNANFHVIDNILVHKEVWENIKDYKIKHNL